MGGTTLNVLALLRRLATAWRLWRAESRLRGRMKAGRDLHVGSGCRFWAPEFIEIGDDSYLGRDVTMETNCRIGRYVIVASRVGFVGRHDHHFRTPGVPVRFGHWVGSERRPSPYRKEAVIVEDDVWIGYGAVLLSGVRVGRGAVVAAGAVVKDNVPRYTIVAGNPAVPVGRRFESAEEIGRHEALVRGGRFEFSEKGYDHWVVEPGAAVPDAAAPAAGVQP